MLGLICASSDIVVIDSLDRSDSSAHTLLGAVSSRVSSCWCRDDAHPQPSSLWAMLRTRVEPAIEEPSVGTHTRTRTFVCWLIWFSVQADRAGRQAVLMRVLVLVQAGSE